jgi:hypothetical protein
LISAIVLIIKIEPMGVRELFAVVSKQ